MRGDKKSEIGLFEKLIFRMVVHIFNAVYLKEKLKWNYLKNDKWEP